MAFDSADGSVEWDHSDCPGDGQTSPHPRQTPALDETANAVFFGSSWFCSVDMTTGSNNWATPAGAYIGAAGIAIDSLQNSYVGYATNNAIYSFDSGGTSRWTLPAAGRVQAVASGDILFTGSLVAWDTSGNQLWQASDLTRPVMDAAGNIYASSTAGAEVVSLTAAGTERWRRSLAGQTWAEVDFVDSSGRVYARAGQTLYALDTAAGELEWAYTGAAELVVGAILTPGGRLLLSDNAATLTVLATALDYAPSAWPIALLGNRRHTQKTSDTLTLPAPETQVLAVNKRGSGSGTITSKYVVAIEAKARKLRADGQGVETEIPLDDWIDVGVFGEKRVDGKTEETVLFLDKRHITEPEVSFELVVDERPVRAGIDPYNKLIDRDSDDNVRRVAKSLAVGRGGTPTGFNTKAQGKRSATLGEPKDNPEP